MKQPQAPRTRVLALADQVVKWLGTLALLGTAMITFAAHQYYETLAALASLAILWLAHALIRRIFPGEQRHWLQIAIDLYLVEAGIMGTVLNFYNTIPFYDKINHGVVGILAAVIGLLFFYRLNPSQRNQLTVQPGFVAMFCLGFTMTYKVLWEFYEFTGDRLFNTNMQRWQASGLNGLIDTMLDLAFGMACALAVSLFIMHQLKMDADGFYQKHIRCFFDNP
jgi:hypothetical protein